jgi:hypothetical protein
MLIAPMIHVAIREVAWRRARKATVPRTSTLKTTCPLG